jgi:micrococcal nuclease
VLPQFGFDAPYGWRVLLGPTLAAGRPMTPLASYPAFMLPPTVTRSPATRALSVVAACLLTLGLVSCSNGPAEASGKRGHAYRVTGVSDGDTIKVVVKGRTERVRLVGIDTPELGRDGAADQCHARAARSAMTRTVRDTRVHLVRDTTQANRDTYGRLLRYVYTAKGGRDVGRTLIAAGHGREYTFKGRAYKHRSAHRSAERKAKAARRGLWGSCGRS